MSFFNISSKIEKLMRQNIVFEQPETASFASVIEAALLLHVVLSRIA